MEPTEAPEDPAGPFALSETGGPCSDRSRPLNVLGSIFHIDERYEIVDIVGSGAYGIVVSARDKRTGEMVAIKKIEKAFDHPTFTKRTLRELKILRLAQHENIIAVKTLQLPRSRSTLSEIYVISELMQTDLSSIIRSPQLLSDEHCQFFAYQIMRGLKYLHSANIMHRDLKPRNLLVNSNCDLKICDFGLARVDLPNLQVRAANMTDYVATRWYRAPEVLLTSKCYTKAIDVWSVGCILGELLVRMPIMPGTNAQNQLDLIFNLIGTPTAEDIESITNLKAKEKALRVPRRSSAFDSRFAGCNPEAVDLLKQMLIFDPNKRITVDMALNHPYFAQLHFPEDEPTTESVSYFDFLFEREVLSMEELKDKIYEEILLYHFPQKKEEYERHKHMSPLFLPTPTLQADSHNSSEEDELI